ncbi:MAG: hypothetical protein M0Z36_07430 [Thermaerobacter sp.]|nr:hypothetical protein [Thermaerobacter sp.]
MIVYRAAVSAKVVTIAIFLFGDPEKPRHFRHRDSRSKLGNIVAHTGRYDDQHIFAAEVAASAGDILPPRSFLQASIYVH